MSVSPRDATKLCYFRCLLEFCKVSQFVSQLVPRLACYDGRGIVRPETMAGGTFLSLQTLHHDTSLRDIDYCYILSVTLMAFLRSHLDPRPLLHCIEHGNFWPLYLSWLLKNDSIETNCIVFSLFMNVLVLKVLPSKCNNAVRQSVLQSGVKEREIHWAGKGRVKTKPPRSRSSRVSFSVTMGLDN